MAVSTRTKDERLQVRLDDLKKAKLQRAANYTHTTLSEFVLETALERADEVIQEHEVITLSDREWTRFMDALAKPAAPNATLKKALARYKKSVTNGALR
jgi:uncharacterized protein (DUF1778 family)